MRKLKRILIMAGGTGGHIFPGLAVANYFRDHNVHVHWLGTAQSMEARIVPEHRIPFHVIPIQGLRRKGIQTALMAPLKIAAALKASLCVLKEVNPDVVIGMGGYVSGPGGVASFLMHRPLIIHEQNAKAGLTNKILARLATRVLDGFGTAFKPQTKVITIGNPLRAEIINLPPPHLRMQLTSRLRLLVLGGSLGAQALNDLVPRALAQLDTNERPEIIHQTGEGHLEHAKKAYEMNGVSADLCPFIQNIASAYSWADVVLCRAGALTVAELCAAGLGAIFVPFPFAVDDHQTANASFMVKNKAALCIQQTALSETYLTSIIRELMHVPEKRLAMAQAAYALRKVDAAERMFEICEEVCN